VDQVAAIDMSGEWLMAGFPAYLLLAAGPAIVAGHKGRNPVGWYLLGILVTPLVALISVALVPPRPKPGLAPPAGSLCGNCGKPLSPYWRDRCRHCHAAFSEFRPRLPAD
jgi:hypothetical protein